MSLLGDSQFDGCMFVISPLKLQHLPPIGGGGGEGGSEHSISVPVASPLTDAIT